MDYMKSLNRKVITSLMALLLPLLPLAAQSEVGNIKSTLKGVVKDRPQSRRLLLLKQGEDPRINAVDIPIKGGKFEYILNCEYEEQYDLIFYDEFEQGSFRPVSFFSEHGVINFTLHPTDQFDKNIVEGGKLNKEYWDYFSKVLNTSKAVLDAYNAYLVDNYSEVLKKHGALEKDFNEKIKQLSKEGINVSQALKAISETTSQEMSQWQLQYIKENPTIVGYSILFSRASSLVQGNRFLQETNDISPYVDLYQTVFAPKFSDHPYTERMQNLFAGSSIKAGVSFVDFIAVDLTGKPVRLSERIAGKPAVLHLWASWCGPCRKKGKELITIYEEYSNKGLVVVGVARERSISAAEAAIKSDKYPWENLVELNDTEKIWVKYGIGNSGGMVFLIDENGIIVANDPSIEEVRNFLSVNFKPEQPK